MAYLAGEIVTDAAPVLNALGEPSTLSADDVFSETSVLTPSGSTIIPTITATFQSGTYLASFPTERSAPGLYSISLISSETGVEYFKTFNVAPFSATLTQLTTGIPVITLQDFRAQVGDALQDHLRLTATADGSESVFFDAMTLTDSPDALRGSHGIYISATDPALVGTVVRIESNSPTSNSVTFSPALATPTQEGDVLDLFNLSGYGWRLQYYDATTKGVVESAYPDYVIETVVIGDAVFASDEPVINLPEELVAVYGLELAEPDTLTQRSVTRARRGGTWGVGWSVDRGLRQLRIDGGWRDLMEGGSYRIKGYARHAVPTAGTDPIAIDLQWLKHEVQSRLAARKSTSSNSWQNWAVEWGRLASEERGRIMTPREANTVWL